MLKHPTVPALDPRLFEVRLAGPFCECSVPVHCQLGQALMEKRLLRVSWMTGKSPENWDPWASSVDQMWPLDIIGGLNGRKYMKIL